MATTSRTRTSRGPVSGAGQRMGRTVAGNAKRGWKRTLRRHPGVGVLVSVVLAVAAVALLVVGLLAENLLYFLATGLSALGSVAITRARHLEAQRQQQQRATRARPAGPTEKPQTPPKTEAPRASTSAAAGGRITCTETGQPIEDCGCASRHVATPEGAKRYGLPVGSPLGRRKREQRPAATARRAD